MNGTQCDSCQDLKRSLGQLSRMKQIVLALLVSQICVLAVGGAMRSQNPENPIVITDENGTKRIELGIDKKNNAKLRMYNPEGIEIVTIGTDTNTSGSSLTLSKSNKQAQVNEAPQPGGISLISSDRYSSIIIHGHDLVPRASLAVHDSGQALFKLNNGKMLPILQFSVDSDGSYKSWILNKDGTVKNEP